MTKIKICGLMREIDADYVNECNPDYVGFIFAAGRRRTIDYQKALIIKKKLNKNIKAVGVYLDQDIDYIKEAVNNNIIDAIQLHGHESDDYIKKLKAEVDLPIINAYNESEYADFILFDNIKPGSGEAISWSECKSNKPYFIAGGINLDNIGEVLKLKPYCIDVSSGAETDGAKDKEKIKRIVEMVRNYEG